MPLPSAFPWAWLFLGCWICAAWLTDPPRGDEEEGVQDRQAAARARMVDEQIARREVRRVAHSGSKHRCGA
jgi:hypothetical protein